MRPNAYVTKKTTFEAHGLGLIVLILHRKIHIPLFPNVCVCVCFLPIHSGHQVRWAYQPGSHRRKATQDF